MDRFKINSQQLSDFYQREVTLREVFSDIESDLKHENKVVCQFIVNGVEIDEKQEEKFSQLKINEIETLEYLSENVNELLIDVIEAWIESFPEMIQNTEKLSKQIRFSGVKNSLKNIEVLIENYEYLISSVISIKNLLGNSAAAGLTHLNKAEEKTKNTLEEAISALEKKDFVCLADIIEYELITSLQGWELLLNDLLNLLNGERKVDDAGERRNKIISSFTHRGRMAN